MSVLAGYVRTSGTTRSPQAVAAMLESMSRRGPDDAGTVLINSFRQDWLNIRYAATPRQVTGCVDLSDVSDFPHNIALGHRRFAVVDLTVAAHQPMWSDDQRLCISFDGRIHNRAEVRSELESEGAKFRGHGDAELVMEAYRNWGEGCWERLAGMWAVALYDTQRRAVMLCRDRVGQSPLYFAYCNGSIWWASDLTAMFAVMSQSDFPVNEQAVSDFLAFGYRDMFHRTFYQGINAFPAASFAWIDANGQSPTERYWQVPTKRWTEGQISVEDAARQVREHLDEAVTSHVTGDTPVGFELSGGMDSSSLVAAAASAGVPVCAYTIAFPQVETHDELKYARLVQERYGQKVELRVVEQPIGDFFAAADEYVGAMGEPFHSPNMLSNQRLWKAMAADGVRSSINGSAGDEMFWLEYERYLAWLLKHGKLLALHREIKRNSEGPTAGFSDRLYRWRLRRAFIINMHQKMSGMMQRRHETAAMASLGGFGMKLPTRPRRTPFQDVAQLTIDDMTVWQLNYWLCSDRQSAGTIPIELRMPYLDHRLIEFAFRLPVRYLMRDGWNKWILRKAVQDLLPEEVVWRQTKWGFPFPYKKWYAASREIVGELLHGLDCPYIESEKLMAAYDPLAESDPKLLWRSLSLALWWKKCILGQSLSHLAAEVSSPS